MKKKTLFITTICSLSLLSLAGADYVGKKTDDMRRVCAAENAADGENVTGAESAADRESEADAADMTKTGPETVNGWDANVDDTIYCVASVSKVYVTTAVMQLVDQGKVDLDAPVTDYINDFRMADERYKDITVRMLMDHSSGLMGTTLKDDALINDNVLDRERLVLTTLVSQRLKADPGAYSCYCNDGFELLAIIVSRVSGMDYTTYVEKNIAGRIGASSIGTADNMFENENLVDVYSNGKCYGKEYCTDYGAGGIVSNVRDTCEFGSAFFKGDNRLLSENSKDEMNTLAARSPYNAYGLGWDEVSIRQYEDAGVKVLSKGGDSLLQHTNLLVAPDEKVSVCVATSGGSSGYNKAVCEALLNIALEEQGTVIEEVTAPEAEFQSKVPDSYKKYEGYYVSGLGSGIMEVSFPNMEYMLLKSGAETTTESYFKYTDKGFVRVKGEIGLDHVKADPEYTCYTFEEINGGIYVVADMISNDSGLINNENTLFIAEMLAPNPVSSDVISAWKERKDQKYVITTDKYSSGIYDSPFTEFVILDDTGYLLIPMKLGARILKIFDENTAVCYTTIPGDAGRDVFDISINEDGSVSTTVGYSLIPVDACEKLTKTVSEVALQTEHASWYRIDDSLANMSISIARPKNSAIFVYDKYGDVVYSSHMKDYGDSIPLPKGGYIVFLGEDGGSAGISYGE
ncbi:MAG: beta-lactamase family protein [Lachnospiraceae bacterium]|nr:beta-lactamase family protein [Lachnospiraceae bacterium]